MSKKYFVYNPYTEEFFRGRYYGNETFTKSEDYAKEYPSLKKAIDVAKSLGEDFSVMDNLGEVYEAWD